MERSLISLRSVYDGLSHLSQPYYELSLNSELKRNVCLARTRYSRYLEEERAKKVESEGDKRRREEEEGYNKLLKSAEMTEKTISDL